MSLYHEIAKGLPATIEIPKELEIIVNWYESSDQLIGGLFEFYADSDLTSIEYWFGNAALADRFGVFGMMPDGSLIAFWIDEANIQKIILLGSEGENQLILADNFLDFIRLIAIGYDDFSYIDFDNTIVEHNQQNENELNYCINVAFQKWFINQFQTTIPERGSEIVNSNDTTFSDWVEKQLNS